MEKEEKEEKEEKRLRRFKRLERKKEKLKNKKLKKMEIEKIGNKKIEAQKIEDKKIKTQNIKIENMKSPEEKNSFLYHVNNQNEKQTDEFYTKKRISEKAKYENYIEEANNRESEKEENKKEESAKGEKSNDISMEIQKILQEKLQKSLKGGNSDNLDSYKTRQYKREKDEKERTNQETIEFFEDMEEGVDIISQDDEKPSKYRKETVIFKPKKNKILFRVIWIVFLTLIAVLLAGYAMVAMNDMLGIGADNSVVTIDIPEKANVDMVAKILKDKGIIKQEFFFKIYAIMTKNSKGFVTGTYELSANMDYQVLINKMKSHETDKDVVEIAFREGLNLQEYADILSENNVCESKEFLEKCKSDDFDEKYDFLKEIKNKKDRVYKLEGYLFPDTYEFYKNEDTSSVIKRFLNNFQRKIIKLNSIEGYEQKTSIKYVSEEKGKSLDEIINIASLIQAEAADKSDMYKVSSVIYNRLETLSENGLNKFKEYGLSKLGIDSTIWYPYKTKNTVPDNIVSTFKSNYNTYEITGLPPGPICNPGMQAIYAALNPDNTEYFYFCHSASGEAYYAKTNDVHLGNLKKAGLV